MDSFIIILLYAVLIVAIIRVMYLTFQIYKLIQELKELGAFDSENIIQYQDNDNSNNYLDCYFIRILFYFFKKR